MNSSSDTPASAPAAAPEVHEIATGSTRYRICLPDAQTDYIQKRIASERMPYEVDMLKDMQARVSPGDLVLDIGANVGNHTLFLAAVGCRVHAFEPNEHLCDALARSVALNGFESLVQLHRVGVGAEAACARFGESQPTNLGAQSLVVGEGDLPVVRLDDMPIEGRIAAMKVDVEGMELDVLRGGRERIARDRPIIYAECIDEASFRSLSRWLDQAGYFAWDTFNATPTHLFVPDEAVDTQRRLARLHMHMVREDYRTAAINAGVRQRLMNAYANEREGREKIQQLSVALAQRQAELDAGREVLKTQAESLRAQLESIRNPLTESLGTTQQLMSRLHAEMTAERQLAQRTTVAALEERLQAALGELDSARLQIESSQQERDLAAASIERLRSSFDEAQAQHAAADEAARARLQAAMDELALARQQIESTRQERDLAAASMERLRSSLDEAQAEHAAAEEEAKARLQQAQAESRRAQAEIDLMRRELDDQRSRIQTLDAELSTWTRVAESRQKEILTMQAELAGARDDRGELQSRVSSLSGELERAIAASAARGNELRTTQAALAVAEAELRNLQGRFRATEERLDRAKHKLQDVRASAAFELGQAVIGALKSPASLMRLPAQLWAIRGRVLQRRQAARTGTSDTPPLAALPAAAPTPVLPAAAAAQSATVAGAARAALTVAKRAPIPAPEPVPAPVPAPRTAPDQAQATTLPRRAAPPRLAQLRVACIFDEFTAQSFGPECQLLALDPACWERQMVEFDPDFVFIESAWRGSGGLWERKVSDASPELDALLTWTRSHGVPTAFWCKEDPVHFSRFLPVARRVDHVFTTDIDCIDNYRAALKHDRVHLLMFAAQPALHNPVQMAAREDAFCFAGSYYPRYEDRKRDFATLAAVARTLRSLVIFDRNAERPPPHDFVFPPEYQAEVVGSLPYAQIDRAYKGYRYGITVNTVKQSQTMFARRAFELLACNTVVVSNYSRGLRLLFGDLVFASDDAAELQRRLAPLCADDTLYRRHRLRGLRKVLSEHTYAHRLEQVAQAVLGPGPVRDQAVVRVLAEPADETEARRVIDAARRQRWPGTRLVLVGAHARARPPEPDVEVLADRQSFAESLGGHEWVAVFDPADHYGAYYLQDLALATRFATRDVLTKEARHVLSADGNPALLAADRSYRTVADAPLRRSLVRAGVCRAALVSAEGRLGHLRVAGGGALAIDEFNYCEGGAGAASAGTVDVADAEHSGMSLQHDLLPEVRRRSEIPLEDDGFEPIELAPADWTRLLPKEIDARLSFVPAGDDEIALESSLEASAHQYVYLTRRFSREELTVGTEKTYFQWESQGSMDLRTVLVFLDAKGNKLSHVMHAIGARYVMPFAEGARSVRLALRVQGAGQVILGKLMLAARDVAPRLLSPARYLVVATQYASYDDLYRYAFVHARVRAYARTGERPEILRVSNDPKVRYREFENIDISEGGASRLRQALSAGRFESVLVHILDQRMWNVIRPALDGVRVVIWIHGAEIQPWWRRAMNFDTDGLRDQVRRTSDARLAMWREVLTLRHPNLDLVFVSHKQMHEALSDLRLTPEAIGRTHVISNFIDGDLFPYREKKSELRHRVLSIRPYASAVYANDQAVEAIRLLAKQPFFSQLHFKLVGDGALFDETVAPLRGMPNVELVKSFLTQHEIAALHGEYGVFLVPSRMDSQGVSRDEAMASGLVPVTTRVAAIPEFVDERCGMLAGPEDPAGLAAAIARLHEDPALFSVLSRSAAQRVRQQSGFAQTIGRELALANGTPDTGENEGTTHAAAPLQRLAIYGDVNLNIMDGSAIWAASLAETLALAGHCRVSLVLKARVQRTAVIAPLLDKTPQIRLIEPDLPDRGAMAIDVAVPFLERLYGESPFDGLVLRGLALCERAVQSPTFRGRIWAYLTDIPQQADEISAEARQSIEAVIAGSHYVLCQTPQMLAYFEAQFPLAAGKTRLLPPMVPRVAASENSAPPLGGPFKLAYAGKFAPRWGIRELMQSFAKLRDAHPDAELHVYGDKIHNPPDDPQFKEEVSTFLQHTPGVHWHGAVDRDTLMREIRGMHLCWAFRDPSFERQTLELSTKALEYASLSKPVLLTRSTVLEGVFGTDYALFADNLSGATSLLLAAASDSGLIARAGERLRAAVAEYTFERVCESLIDQGLLQGNGARASGRGRAVD